MPPPYSVWHWLDHRVELISQLGGTLAAAIVYGIIEARWIPTGQLDLIIFGRFSQYHLYALILWAIVSFQFSWSHLEWIRTNRGRYVLSFCSAALMLFAMFEDASWYIVQGKAIGKNDWTMIKPGWGIDLGFTWVPYWYIAVIVVSSILIYLSNRYANIGYNLYKKQKSGEVRKAS